MSNFKMGKIIVYATGDKGEGRVMEVGRYEDMEDIEILVGMFDKDVQISFEYEKIKEELPDVA